jgi:hypothetical protein
MAYASYYNRVRTHLSLDKDSALFRRPKMAGTIAAIPILAASSLRSGLAFRLGQLRAIDLRREVLEKFDSNLRTSFSAPLELRPARAGTRPSRSHHKETGSAAPRDTVGRRGMPSCRCTARYRHLWPKWKRKRHARRPERRSLPARRFLRIGAHHNAEVANLVTRAVTQFSLLPDVVWIDRLGMPHVVRL